MESINYLCNHTTVSKHHQHVHLVWIRLDQGSVPGRTPTVNTSGLSSDGLETLGGGAGPPWPGGGFVTFVSWLTFPVFTFFVSGLLASRRKVHLCWMQELNLAKTQQSGSGQKRRNLSLPQFSELPCHLLNNTNLVIRTFVCYRVYILHISANEPAGGATG